MKIQPLADRVVVRRVEEAEKTAGGILIPNNAKEKPMEGIVVAVGPGKYQKEGTLRPVGVKVEERILFGKYGGTEVKIDGEDLLILSENDILGVIEN